MNFLKLLLTCLQLEENFIDCREQFGIVHSLGINVSTSVFLIYYKLLVLIPSTFFISLVINMNDAVVSVLSFFGLVGYFGQLAYWIVCLITNKWGTSLEYSKVLNFNLN